MDHACRPVMLPCRSATTRVGPLTRTLLYRPSRRGAPHARRSRVRPWIYSVPPAPMEPTKDLSPLLRSARDGAPGAMDGLMERVLPELRAYVRLNAGQQIRRMESSSDLVQSICREVLEDLGGFRGDGAGQFRHWLFTVALNKIQMKGRHYGAQKRDVQREAGVRADESILGAYGSICTPSRHAAANEELGRIESAFDRLPDDYRQVLTLCCMMELPHREVAEQMQRNEPAVRKLLSRARARLGLELALDEEDEGGR